MAVTDPARDTAFAAIEAERESIQLVCREIHHDPELSLQEHRASERLATFLEAHGFSVERGVAGLPTAFHARFDRIDPEVLRKGARHAHLGLIVEYDAMPEVGHAHGHPVGTAAVLAAALGLKAALKDEWGSLSVVGCPGTAASAKLKMVRTGLFAPMDAVIGAHPAPAGEGFFYTIDSSGNTVGSAQATVTFPGKGFPDDAADRLRELLTSSPPETLANESVASIGDAERGLVVEVRALSRKRIVELLVAIKEMAQSLQSSSDEEIGFSVANVYDDMIVSRVIARRMNTYAFNLGFRTDKSYKMPIGEPSEWGNVSYETPTFQAFFPVASEAGDAVWGEASFTTAADTDDAYNQAFRVAEAMAFVSLDIIRDIDFRAVADNQLVKALGLRGENRAHRRWTGLHPVRPKETTNGARKGPQLKDFKIVREAPANDSDGPAG